jgi:hypothetical protein
VILGGGGANIIFHGNNAIAECDMGKYFSMRKRAPRVM